MSHSAQARHRVDSHPVAALLCLCAALPGPLSTFLFSSHLLVSSTLPASCPSSAGDAVNRRRPFALSIRCEEFLIRISGPFVPVAAGTTGLIKVLKICRVTEKKNNSFFKNVSLSIIYFLSLSTFIFLLLLFYFSQRERWVGAGRHPPVRPSHVMPDEGLLTDTLQ